MEEKRGMDSRGRNEHMEEVPACGMYACMAII